MPPGTVHSLHGNSHSLLELYEVKFTVSEPLQNIALPMIRTNSAYTAHALQHVVYNWSRGIEECRSVADHHITAWLLAMQDMADPACNELYSYIDASPYPPLIRRILRHIDETHTEHFSLDSLSEAVQYNKRYLCTKFKQITGITIMDYVNHMRLRHAASCLYYHDVPIGVVAQYVGFISPIHFSRVFKELVGISPTQFCECYCLKSADQRESHRLTQHLSDYEMLLGEKLLTLDESIHALRKLGRRVTTK